MKRNVLKVLLKSEWFKNIDYLHAISFWIGFYIFLVKLYEKLEGNLFQDVLAIVALLV